MTAAFLSRAASMLAGAFPWLVVVVLSVLVASGELVSRFRDAPIRLFRSPLAWLYCVVNALAAVLTFGFIHESGWTAGLAVTSREKITWIQAFTAAFSAMVLLRSSLFRVRIGNQDVDVGPATVLQQLLAAVDREIDRQEGQFRLLSVDALKDLNFEETFDAAPALCAGVLQSLTADQQAKLKDVVSEIKGGKGSEQIRLQLLAIELINVAGPEILNAVAKKLRGAG